MSLLVMLGGLLILVQGAINLAVANPPLQPPSPIIDLVKAVGGFQVVGAISIVAGLIVILGGWLIRQKKKRNGSLLAIVFAVVGFAGGGGFIIGTILGFFGGILNFRVVE